MVRVSFLVVDGVDKGRSFLNLSTPVTVGREEGNIIRLNDERVSRFHCKVQEDQGQIVLTDLDSTNGTCVNGDSVQLRLLRPGDRLDVGRSSLIFGTLEEIAASLREQKSKRRANGDSDFTDPQLAEGQLEGSLGVAADEEIQVDDNDGHTDVFERVPPKLPARLSPAQAAQLSEVLDFLHRAMADATEKTHVAVGGKEARLPVENWQRVQAVLAFLAKYSRQISEPDEPTEKLA